MARPPTTSSAAAACIGLCSIIFAECGLLVGFFLPGDTLLFAAGVLVKKGTFDHPLWYVILLDVHRGGGRQPGRLLDRPPRRTRRVPARPNSRLFRPEYVERTAAFFERCGTWAIVLARFVPVVRTFVTVMAGASRMNYRTFTIFTIIGGALWTTSVTCLGYAFGNVALIADHVELILLAGVAVVGGPGRLALLADEAERRSRPDLSPSGPDGPGSSAVPAVRHRARPAGGAAAEEPPAGSRGVGRAGDCIRTEGHLGYGADFGVVGLEVLGLGEVERPRDDAADGNDCTRVLSARTLAL